MSDELFFAIRAAIRRSPLTVYQIADRSGVSRETLDRWLDGRTRKPYSETMAKVVEALGLHVTLAMEGNTIDRRPRALPPLRKPPRMALWRLQ